MLFTSTTQSTLVLALIMLAAACSGPTTGGQAAPVPTPSVQAAPIPIDQALASEVNAFCNGYSTCCSSKGFAFNAAACQTNLRAQFGDSICPAQYAYDAQAAGDCFAQLQATYASCSKSPNPNSPCYRVCTGTLPEGSACTNSLDCAVDANVSVSCTTAGTTSTTPICVVHPRGKLGDGCTSTCDASMDGDIGFCYDTYIPAGGPTPNGTANCFSNDGLYCSSVDFICQPLVAIGGTCAATSDCQTDAYCDRTVFVCKARLAAGGACPQLDECMNDLYCNTNLVCANKLPIGATCQSAVACIDYCDSSTSQCVAAKPTKTSDLNVTASSCANPTQS